MNIAEIKMGVYISEIDGIVWISESASPTTTLINDFRAEFLSAVSSISSITSIVLVRTGGTVATVLTVSPGLWNVTNGVAILERTISFSSLVTLTTVRVMAGTKTYFVSALSATLSANVNYVFMATLAVNMVWSLTLFIENMRYGCLVQDATMRREIVRKIIGQRTSAIFPAWCRFYGGSVVTITRGSTFYVASCTLSDASGGFEICDSATIPLATVMYDTPIPVGWVANISIVLVT